MKCGSGNSGSGGEVAQLLSFQLWTTLPVLLRGGAFNYNDQQLQDEIAGILTLSFLFVSIPATRVFYRLCPRLRSAHHPPLHSSVANAVGKARVIYPR